MICGKAISAEEPWAGSLQHRPRRELRFIADLARRMRPSVLQADAMALHEQCVIRDLIATGTQDAALWVLGITDLAPASGTVCPAHTGARISREAKIAATRRQSFEASSPQWLYLGGVLDALAFAMGDEEPFWWVPLPEVMRVGPPRRDEYGREIG